MSKVICTIAVIAALISCNSNMVKSEYSTTDDSSWGRDAILEFTFSELDTIQPYDMFINVRNDETFQYNNLFLIAELNFPNGNTVTDTLEYEMALPDGTWLGKGSGGLKESKLWYKENIVFSTSGVHTLRIAHAMRKNGSVNGVVNLEGITDVGFEIVKK